MAEYYVYIKKDIYDKGEETIDQCRIKLEDYLLAYGGTVLDVSEFSVKHPNFRIELDPKLGENKYFKETIESRLTQKEPNCARLPPNLL